MSGPALATSYEESVGSCGPPTPHTPPSPSVTRGAPVRRQLDFTGGGDLEDNGDDEFLCRVADDIERGYSKAKRRATACVCGRGVCAVERDDKSGLWKYVCPSRPKCNHIAFFEEVDLNPQSQPTSRSHLEPINPCAFNDPSNRMAGPRTPINVRPLVTGTTTPFIVRPQVVGATTLFSDSPPGAGVTTLVNVSRHGEGASTPANDSPHGVGTTTPAKFIPQGAVAVANMPAKFIPQGAFATTPAKVSPQGAITNERPVCQCTAGKCKKSRIGEEDWYVCPIPKGKGACSYRVVVSDFVKDMVPSAQSIPCDEVHPKSPSMLHRPIAAVNTPSKSQVRSPISPISRHWMKDCPKQSPKVGACFKCGMDGHWIRNCPQL